MSNSRCSKRRSFAFGWVLFSLLLANPLFSTTVSSQFSLGGYLSSGSPDSFDLAYKAMRAAIPALSDRLLSAPLFTPASL